MAFMRSLVLAFGVSLAAVAADPQAIFTVLGDRRGEVIPCGCPRIQLGGLDRLVAYCDAQPKASARFVIDTGNTFFSLPELPQSRHAQENLKADLIADAYKLLAVDLLVPGRRDMALGPERLQALAKRASVDLVATDWETADGKPLFTRSKILERVGKKFGFVSIVRDALAPVENEIERLRKHPVDAVILIAQGGDLESARSLNVDVVLTPPQEEGKGLANILWDSASKKIVREEVALGPEWQKPGRFAKAQSKYLESIRSLAVDKSGAFVVRPKGAFVAQAGVCRQCHEKQTAFWESTKHASAYLVLFSKNQHFDPECIGCHSVGYRDAAGFSDIASPIRLVGQPPRKKGEIPFVETFMKEVFEGDKGGALDSRVQPERYASLKAKYHAKIRDWQTKGQLDSLHMGVQCEHCHGNRDGHPGPQFKKVGKVRAASCTKCHQPPHDNAFNFAKKVKQVACPRM